MGRRIAPTASIAPKETTPYTVSYVVVGRWSSHGEGYVELDCAGRAVGDREAADPAVEGAAAGRWNAGHT
jgi:hypothetical protein